MAKQPNTIKQPAPRAIQTADPLLGIPPDKGTADDRRRADKAAAAADADEASGRSRPSARTTLTVIRTVRLGFDGRSSTDSHGLERLSWCRRLMLGFTHRLTQSGRRELGWAMHSMSTVTEWLGLSMRASWMRDSIAPVATSRVSGMTDN